MYVKSISFSQLRCFRGAELDLLYPGREQETGFEWAPGWPSSLPNVNLLLGTNGAGKSTALMAVALAVLSPVIQSSGFKPHSLVRRDPRKKGASPAEALAAANLVFHPQDGPAAASAAEPDRRVETRVRKRGDHEVIYSDKGESEIWEGMYNDDSPAFLMVGYGATRRVESTSRYDESSRRQTRFLRYERVASLFEDHFALVPLTAWLPEMKHGNPGRHKQVCNLINRLLPAGIRFTGTYEKGDYLFRHRQTDVPFAALSDGFRAYIGWIADLLHHVCMGCPSGKKLVENRGVVMVDEIDLHIHPEWQRTVIPRIAETLPGLQFIFTTHSPIVVGTLEAANLFYVKSSARGASRVERSESEMHGLSADQILRSAVFGLESTRSPTFVRELRDVSQRASAGEPGAAVELMRKVARGKAGSDVDDEEVPAWVQQAAAKRGKTS